jgi:transcriptional regulator GlxA family with amidase domain
MVALGLGGFGAWILSLPPIPAGGRAPAIDSREAEPGSVILHPALEVQPDATVAEFDARYPDGADYVIVPAMSRNEPAAVAWITRQAAKGATVIGVCAGAKIVGAAGLLEGKRATTHWYDLREFRRKHPGAVYIPDRRLVFDRKVVTTTGVNRIHTAVAHAHRSYRRAVARRGGRPRSRPGDGMRATTAMPSC